jgi:hypothetical protein
MAARRPEVKGAEVAKEDVVGKEARSLITPLSTSNLTPT